MNSSNRCGRCWRSIGPRLPRATATAHATAAARSSPPKTARSSWRRRSRKRPRWPSGCWCGWKTPKCFRRGWRRGRESSPPSRGLRAALLIIEAITQNHLDQQMIRGLRHPDSDAEVEFPVLAEVDIHRGQKLLLLIAHRIEARHRTVGAVIFQAHGEFLGHVVTELHVG